MEAPCNKPKSLKEIFPKTDHYDGMKCLESIENNVPEFFTSTGAIYFFNICKYLWRKDRKGNPDKDLEKADFYFQKYIEKGGSIVILQDALGNVLRDRDACFPRLDIQILERL